MMTLVGCVVYCNSKCHYWFRHSLTFSCMDSHYFKHCFVVMANGFVGKLFTRWPCAGFSPIMSIISQCISSSRRTPLSLGILVMFYQHCYYTKVSVYGCFGILRHSSACGTRTWSNTWRCITVSLIEAMLVKRKKLRCALWCGLKKINSG